MLCLLHCHLLLIFITGNYLSDVSGDCGGETNVLGERNGSLWYSFTAGLHLNNLKNDGTAKNKTENITCTWIINAEENQTVWVNVVHIDEDTSLRLKFINKTIVNGHKNGALFAGTGRTTVEWSWRNGTKALRTLHLRWNTSEDGHDPAHVPYTHFDHDSVSPSPDALDRLTHAPDILGFGSGSPTVSALRGVSVQQGVGVSASDDKSGPPIPQEGSHNEQEKAGAAISDLVYTVTHSLADTQSILSYTRAQTHTVTQTAPPSLHSSAEAKSPQLFAHTLAGHDDGVAMATSAHLNRETDNAYTAMETQSLTKKTPPNVSNKQTGTEIYSRLHNSTGGTLLNSAASVVSSPTVSLVVDSVTNNESAAIDPKVHKFHSVTNSDMSMTSSVDEGLLVVTVTTQNRTQNTETEMDQTNRPLRSAHPYQETPLNRKPGLETDQTNQFLGSTNPNQNIPHGRTTATEMDLTSQSLGSTQPNQETPLDRTQGTEINQTKQSLTSAHHNRDVLEQTQTMLFDHSSTPAVVTHNPTIIDKSSHSEGSASESPFLRTLTTSREDTPLAKQPSLQTHPPNPHMEHTTQPAANVPSPDFTTKRVEHGTVTKDSFTFLPSTIYPSKANTDPSSAFPKNMLTTPFNMLRFSPVTSVEQLTKESRTSNLALTSPLPKTVGQDAERERESSTTYESGSISPDVIITSTLQVHSPDLMMQGTAKTEEPLEQNSATNSPPGTQFVSSKHQAILPHTLSPHILTAVHSTEPTTAVSQNTNFPWTDHSTNDINHADSSQSGISLGPMIPVSISPSISTETGSTEPGHALTERNNPVTPTNHSPVITRAGEAVSTRIPSFWDTSKTSVVNSPLLTTPFAKITPTPTSLHPTKGRKTALRTHFPTEQPSTHAPTAQMNTNSYLTASNTASPPLNNPTSWLRHFTLQADSKDWSHKARILVVEDQPAIIKVEMFQVLLQVVLEENPPSYVGLVEVEPFLHKVEGYQSQQVTWHSGPVLQTVVTFRTVEALSWLGRAESLLHEAMLSPLPREGIFVGGARVKNITVGGLHTDVCSWLFTCPSGFQCVSSKGNASCSSVCHSEYCKHQGICVHRSGQQPLCQCPVGEDYWFMGRRCDLRMTRQRLVGVCFGVLLAVALLMAVLSYLAVRRFKTMLIQAKVDQTRSSYRRFNHFDELSARFWGRSWPGSEDSLDNPAFTRSDELLHMRALDRTCCYHDDTLSITSTYQGSVSHLNTVYPHSSQYRWDLSNYSLADGVVDSGKASDLSVCSWPIEPIQWTPFPLLQQLSKNTASVKASRPRSYCEGMELVDMEKSWTA